MRTRIAICGLILLLLPACTTSQPEPVDQKRVIVAVATGVTPPFPQADDVTVKPIADPLGELTAGRAAIAVVKGPRPPQRWESFPLSTSEQVIMQGWLDAPFSLTKAEAEAKLVALTAPGSPGPGALARGQLKDMKLGWRAVPVDGITPTPDTLRSGAYPLSGLVSVAYSRDADARTRTVVDRMKTQAEAAQASWATLTVAGDYMLSRGVARAMGEKGTLYPVDKVKEHLSAADITFANLESPIGVTGKALPGKQIWFRAAPEAVNVLQASGVDAVALANNHILDYDTDNFLETISLLDGAGIRHVGGGRNITDARKPLIMEAKGVRIAFLAYSQFADLFFDYGYPRAFSATDTLPGVPRIQADWIAADVKAARAQADIVAIAYHWGDEFQNYPNDEQRRIAHLSIDSGADLVLGYHPHAIQGFEMYKDRFIVYSTGNFIMDRQDTDLARESMILDFAVSKGGVRSVSVSPVWIRDEQPYIMTGAEGERLLAKMRTISGWK